MRDVDAGRAIASLAAGLAVTGAAGWVLGWGSPLVHILWVLVVLLVVYLRLRRR